MRERRERGATAAVVAIVLTLLAALTALVVNVGHMMAVRGQLQNATDASALAASEDLNGTVPGLDAARAVATDYAARHATDRGTPVVLGADDVAFGRWDASARTFTEIAATSPASLAQINAVRVRAGREQARGNPLQVFFSGILRTETVNVRAESIAVLGAPSAAECVKPLVFADCMVKDEAGNLKCGEPFVFHSDGTDTIGFTNLSQDPSVNTELLRRLLTGATCVPVAAGDLVAVSNGAQVNALISELLSLVGERIFVPIVNLPGEGDCVTKFNAHSEGAEITSFGSFTITAVDQGREKAIHFALDCAVAAPPYTPGGGGADFGTIATQPRLVR